MKEAHKTEMDAFGKKMKDLKSELAEAQVRLDGKTRELEAKEAETSRIEQRLSINAQKLEKKVTDQVLPLTL